MRKNLSFEKVGEPARNFLVPISPATERPVSGLGLENFTVYLKNPDGIRVYERNPTDGVVTNAVPVILTEIGTTGLYEIKFTPTVVGYWVIVFQHATYFPYGHRAEYRVFDALYYVENQAELEEPFEVTDAAGTLVANVPLTEFVPKLYDPNLVDKTDSVGVVFRNDGNGDYRAFYSADITGKWLLAVTHPTYFPWGKYADQRYTSNDISDIDVVEAIRNLIVDDTDMRARLATFAFTTDADPIPAVFTTFEMPKNCDLPAVQINRIGGVDYGTRGAEGEDTLIDVRLYGDRRRDSDVLRRTAKILRKLVNRANLTLTDGHRAFRCIADPPALTPDEDGFPGYRISVRVLQLEV